MPTPSGTGRTRVASLKAMSEHELRRRRTTGKNYSKKCAQDPHRSPKAKYLVQNAEDAVSAATKRFRVAHVRAAVALLSAQTRHLRLERGLGQYKISHQGLLLILQPPRFVLSDTQDLHSRIVTMSQRIRQLEDALAITANHSEPNHPLLADHLLSIKFGPETREESMLEYDEAQEEDHHTEDTLQAMGTLGADSQGELRYFGVSGGSGELDWRLAFDLQLI